METIKRKRKRNNGRSGIAPTILNKSTCVHEIQVQRRGSSGFDFIERRVAFWNEWAQGCMILVSIRTPTFFDLSFLFLLFASLRACSFAI